MNNLNTNQANKPKQNKSRELQMTNNKNQTENMSNLPKIRTAYTDLIDYLKTILHQKDIIINPSYAELSKKLGFTYNFTKDKKTFNDLYNRLSKRYQIQLTQEWSIIEDKFKILYNLAFPSDPRLPSMITNRKQSIKRKFFNDIKQIIQEYFPKARIFDTDLSRIFFSRARALKDSHLKGTYKHRRLEFSTLFAFIYKIRFLTPEKLVLNVRDIKEIDSDILNKIKLHIENNIEKFIFSNPYEAKYINDTYDIGAIYFKPEYNLTLDIWIELSKAEHRPILFKVARRILEYYTFGRPNRFGVKGKGSVYSWYGIIKMTKQLTKLLPQNKVYDLVPKLKEYIKIRNLHPIHPRIYHRSWYTKSTVKFHIIMLILRDLGLEILNLEPIKPISFKKTEIMEIFTYIRHHIFPNDKLSVDVNRLVLTMQKNHARLERKRNLILQLIQSHINFNKECPQYYKERFSDWQIRWQRYLKRHSYLIENGIEKFIYHYYTDKNGHNYIIERFFKNTPKGKIESEITTMLKHWIKKKRPAPILNPIINARLVNGAQEQTLRGYTNT